MYRRLPCPEDPLPLGIPALHPSLCLASILVHIHPQRQTEPRWHEGTHCRAPGPFQSPLPSPGHTGLPPAPPAHKRPHVTAPPFLGPPTPFPVSRFLLPGAPCSVALGGSLQGFHALHISVVEGGRLTPLSLPLGSQHWNECYFEKFLNVSKAFSMGQWTQGTQWGLVKPGCEGRCHPALRGRRKD